MKTMHSTNLIKPIGKLDHIEGAEDAPLILLEYGDYECPVCYEAYIAVRKLRQLLHQNIRFVFRNYPLMDIHTHARRAALAGEAANQQGKFWEMHDLLFENQKALSHEDLLKYANQLGLNLKRFEKAMNSKMLSDRISQEINDAEKYGISKTPTFFINSIYFEKEPTFENLLGELENHLKAKRGKNVA